MADVTIHFISSIPDFQNVKSRSLVNHMQYVIPPQALYNNPINQLGSILLGEILYELFFYQNCEH